MFILEKKMLCLKNKKQQILIIYVESKNGIFSNFFKTLLVKLVVTWITWEKSNGFEVPNGFSAFFPLINGVKHTFRNKKFDKMYGIEGINLFFEGN